MTPDAPASPDPAAGRRVVRVRKKRRRHGKSRLLRDVWIPAALIVLILAILVVRYISHLAPPAPVVGYIGSPETLQQEYLEFEGKPLTNSSPVQQFRSANELAAKGDYKGAASLLEGISKMCAVPVVFYDMGLLYAQMNDRERAIAAFRETLAHDPFYEAVRSSMNSMRDFQGHAADPITSELEPNDTCVHANLISLGVDVVGEISSESDTDCFRFSAPRSPRDVLQVEIRNQSTTLEPRIRIYNAEIQPTGDMAESQDPGGRIDLKIAPRPNATLYVEVSGNHKTRGAYALKITATKSFDEYEPNNEMAAARRIPTGKDVNANIMWPGEDDYYSFTADQSGKVTVTIEAFEGLQPSLALFGPDQQLMEVPPGPQETPKKLVRTIAVDEDKAYYIQVSGKDKSTGSYRISVAQ